MQKPHPKHRIDDLWTRIQAHLPGGAADPPTQGLPGSDDPDARLVRRESDTWADTSVPGVRVKVLFESPEENRRTALYQMDPGTSYPAHVHGGAEECFVLSGDLSVGEFTMRQGDYQRVAAGSHHGVQSTRGGCLLFITCAMNDELD